MPKRLLTRLSGASWPQSSKISGLVIFVKLWISLFYKNPRAASAITSLRFTISRGIRQGCPLSPLLFTIVLEPLAIIIRADPNIMAVKGVKKGMEHKLMLFTDDVLLLSQETFKSLTFKCSRIQNKLGEI